MSKTLGTGIDPLEMIDKYGADATRFGLLLMSSSQDVRFCEEKIAMGRNFANKLWNAGRLVLLAAEGVRGAAQRRRRWWTAGSRAASQRASAAVEAAVAAYDFSGRRGRALPLRLGRVLRLVPGARQGRASTATTRRQQAQAAGHARCAARSGRAPGCTRSCPSSPRRSPRSTAPRRCSSSATRSRDETLLAPPTRAALDGAAGARCDALRASAPTQRVPPAQVLQAAFVADDGDAGGRRALRAVRRRLPRRSRAPTVGRRRGRARRRHGRARARRALRGGAPPSTAPRSWRACEQQLAKLEAEVARGEAKLANAGLRERAPAGRGRQGAREARRLRGRPRRARRALPLVSGGARVRRRHGR